MEAPLYAPARYVTVGKGKTVHLSRPEGGTLCNRQAETTRWKGKPSSACTRCWCDILYDDTLPASTGRTLVDRARVEFREAVKEGRYEHHPLITGAQDIVVGDKGTERVDVRGQS